MMNEPDLHNPLHCQICLARRLAHPPKSPWVLIIGAIVITFLLVFGLSQ